jgi:GR25 family glycosyltransferase involved in LPS biosynthesis
MNLSRPLSAPSKSIFRIWMKLRRLLPKQKCRTFAPANPNEQPGIGRIYVINLDRQPDRWAEMERELRHVVNASGTELADLTVRLSAVDAEDIAEVPPDRVDVDPFYTLQDQLFVEPQPRALPDRLELERPIPMTLPEIAVALSHIGVWRRIAAGEQEYSLVLEDDVWFQNGFARYVEAAWGDLVPHNEQAERFDILYLSYKEVKYGAQKTLLSEKVFRPVRGLWYLSGYVLSRGGARKLLRRLPCRGPVDLWINHQFEGLAVRATRSPIIAQRLDTDSTNSYSILPVLNRIGVIDSENASLFHIRPSEQPVFSFRPEGSGLSSLAMALSMLGYRCCSDLTELPDCECERLLSGATDRVFNAYVNIGSLAGKIPELRRLYPHAKFIATTSQSGAVDDISLNGIGNVANSDAVLRLDEANKWRLLCEHLKCAPPVCSFPRIADLGQRRVYGLGHDRRPAVAKKTPKRDRSPWVVESCRRWEGIHAEPTGRLQPAIGTHVIVKDSLYDLDSRRWSLRDDTFPGNLALFRPSNVELRAGVGATLTVRKESLGVRSYSAASISSCCQYLFGRFEAVLQPTNVPGLVTGFFLHRDSPRQEIDIEIGGNRPDRLLANVFYNPGDEGAKFDYGYRGAPSHVDLGFDTSRSAHCFAIEWDPVEIRWLVDDQLVHRRVNWNPTPIPHLPMALHVNSWPSRSKELAGRLNDRLLPATSVVRSIAVDATVLPVVSLHDRTNRFSEGIASAQNKEDSEAQKPGGAE